MRCIWPMVKPVAIQVAEHVTFEGLFSHKILTKYVFVLIFIVATHFLHTCGMSSSSEYAISDIPQFIPCYRSCWLSTSSCCQSGTSTSSAVQIQWATPEGCVRACVCTCMLLWSMQPARLWINTVLTNSKTTHPKVQVTSHWWVTAPYAVMSLVFPPCLGYSAPNQCSPSNLMGFHVRLFVGISANIFLNKH